MKTFRQEVCNLYLWAILLILPILVHNKYQDITGFKLVFFLGVFSIFFICSVIAIIGKYVSYYDMGIELPRLQTNLRSMNGLDWSILFFGLIALISALTSRYGIRHALLADQALFVGGIMLLFLSIAFYLFSRGADAGRMTYIYGFFISASIVVLIGVLNHLKVDPLGMHKENVIDTFDVMASTIGNFDYYHGYAAMALIFFAAYRAGMKYDWKALAVDCFLVICYLDTWTSRAGGTYAGLLFGAAMLVFVGLFSLSQLKNLFWQGILAGIGGLLAEIICYYNSWMWSAIDTEISGYFLHRHLWMPIGVVCLVIWLLISREEKKGNAQKVEFLLQRIQKPYVIFVTLLLVGITFFIVFTPQGGVISGRSFIWDDVKVLYWKGTIREKFLGIGLGCIDLARERFHMYTDPEVYMEKALRYETAHNEIYEYTLEMGVLGIISYIAVVVNFFVSFFREMFRSVTVDDGALSTNVRAAVVHKREFACCAVLFAAYLGQGMTNGPNPVPTIVAFTFLALFRRYQIPDVDEF